MYLQNLKKCSDEKKTTNSPCIGNLNKKRFVPAFAKNLYCSITISGREHVRLSKNNSGNDFNWLIMIMKDKKSSNRLNFFSQVF